MNHIVPIFESDEDYLISELPNKSTMGGDEGIMELLWHNGPVVMQSQNPRSAGNKKVETRPSAESREIRSSVDEEQTGPSDLFMHEDEMASWLHYPTEDVSLEGYVYSNDLLCPPPPSTSSAPMTTAPTSLPPPPPPSVRIPSPRPPVPLFRRMEPESGQPKLPNFMHFGRQSKARVPESSPSKMPPALKPSTVVASNETEAATEAPESRASRVSDKPPPANKGYNGVGAAGISRDVETCELSVTSSPGTGGSGGSASIDLSSQKAPPPIDDRRRKGKDTDDSECHSEDVEFEYLDAKKQSHGSTSTKRARAAEVHNLSERRRRDRINEKMKALQELIPRCNKSDKASMLDEAIEYLKSLQMQVQMMSMGMGMVPMMFPGVQQYMPPMGMGMGVNRPMVPFPPNFPGSSLPNPAAAAAHLSQRFPVPGFNMAPVNPETTQAANISSPMMNSFPLHNNQNIPNFAESFQQYLGLHQTPLPFPQTQGSMIPPIATTPSDTEDTTSPDHPETG